jgi:hypothetical protein
MSGVGISRTHQFGLRHGFISAIVTAAMDQAKKTFDLILFRGRLWLGSACIANGKFDDAIALVRKGCRVLQTHNSFYAYGTCLRRQVIVAKQADHRQTKTGGNNNLCEADIDRHYIRCSG